MPKLKQPSTLEDIVLENLGLYAFRVIQNAITANGSGKTSVINTHSLNQFLHGDLPHALSERVSVHMLSIYPRLLKSLTFPEMTLRDFGETYLNYIVESVILASICPYVTILDMSKLPPLAQKILINNLRTFNKLYKFRITANTVTVDFIKLLSTHVSCLRFLEIFELQFYCTDDIINALGSCCSETIEQIDVTNSRNVTDVSFHVLIQCHKLKRLLISGTSMTSEGYIQFLENIKRTNSDNTTKGVLHVSLGKLCKWVISSRELSEIATSFPMLKRLEIDYLLGDMAMLGNLTQLEVLKLCFCGYDTCNIDGFLHLRGRNLTSLQLRAVYPPIELISIMNHCINLKELILCECKIRDIELEHIKNAAKVFGNLENLELIGQYSLHSIEYILSLCVNIKRLRLCLIDDEFILRLLSKNPLQKLTKFIACSCDLSMKSVDAIIEQCRLLETLEWLDMWGGVTDGEIKVLRNKIKYQNQDLRIKFLTKDDILEKYAI